MRLSAVLQRTLALVFLVVPGLLVYFVLLSPVWQNYRATRDTVADYEARIAHMLGISADAKRLSEQRDVLRIQGDSDRYLIGGASATLAAALLQKRIESIVERSGGRLSSTQVLPPETGQDFVRVAIRAHLALDTPTLQQVLYELESQPPLLIIDDLTVISRGGLETHRPHGAPVNLDVQLRLLGWMARPVEGA